MKREFPPLLSQILLKLVDLYDISENHHVTFNPVWFPDIIIEEQTSLFKEHKRSYRFQISKTVLADLKDNSSSNSKSQQNGMYFIERVIDSQNSRPQLLFYVIYGKTFYHPHDFTFLDRYSLDVVKETMWVSFLFYDQLFRKNILTPEKLIEYVHNQYYIHTGNGEELVTHNTNSSLQKLLILDYMRDIHNVQHLPQRVQENIIKNWQKNEITATNHFVFWMRDQRGIRMRYEPHISSVGDFTKQVAQRFFKDKKRTEVYKNIMNHLQKNIPQNNKNYIQYSMEWQKCIMDWLVQEKTSISRAYHILLRRLVLSKIYVSTRTLYPDPNETLPTEVELLESFTFIREVMNFTARSFTKSEIRYFIQKLTLLFQPRVCYGKTLQYTEGSGYTYTCIPIDTSPTMNRKALVYLLDQPVHSDLPNKRLIALQHRFGLFLKYLIFATAGLLITRNENEEYIFSKRIPNLLTTYILNRMKKMRSTCTKNVLPNMKE